MSQPSDREIREAVVSHYAARARAALGTTESASTAACCGPAESGPATLEFVDLGAQTAAGDACEVGDPDCDPEAAERFGRSLYASTDGVPEAALVASAGCGNPVAIADLRPGEVVLDLGSGGGIDCFFAAQQVGATGLVWGLDMTPDMVALARKNATDIGAENVRFRLGEIEDIPFAEGTFDAIISNCVINLSTDKPQVFREAFRVLKAGGRLRVSDMVWTSERPAGIVADSEEWAGCIAGALPLDEYLGAIRAAGFTDVDATYEETSRGIASAYVSATKPA
jgi:arsenite methyltransferase